jgi:cytochrome c oxidase assembly protein subunit 15
MMAIGNAQGNPVQQRTESWIAAWLLTCCCMVFLMIVVGGVTRLTHSGLSIVEWQPLVGTLPPLNDQQWQEAFAKYQLTPEFQQVNFGMSIAEFRGIFWWEYFHRLLGRLIGFVFFIPYALLLLLRRLHGPLAWKLLGIFLIGGLQGAMGWYMVKSGLVDDPRVSHLRLTAHLGIAFVILAAMFWVALDLLLARRPTDRPDSPDPRVAGLSRFASALAALVFLMVLTGGLVAGIRAGFAYNTFPLMNGQLMPSEIFMIEPWYLNFFNNMATVQFNHRLLAWLLAFLVPWFWWRLRNADAGPRARFAAHVLLGALAVQIALGIATLLLVVPIPLAAAHQGGAVFVFAASLYAARTLRDA